MIPISTGTIGTSTAGTRAVPAPPRLWWMYLLVVFALAAVGAGAGQEVLVAYNLGRFGALETCLTMHGFSMARVPGLASAQNVAQFAACSSTFRHRQNAAMAVGAVVAPLAAWLLMVGGGLQIRRRLGRGRVEAAPTPAARAAAERFEAWCDTWHLSGRRRPRLVLAAPGTGNGEAFTAGLPFTRPVIVVPLGYAYGEPAAFDVVVLHELAHVRSRDVVWAALVWWTGWVSVLMLLAALAPSLTHPGRLAEQDGESLGLALLLSAVALALRAALLRRRESDADRHAVEVLDDREAFLSVLSEGLEAADPPTPTGPGARLRSAWSRRGIDPFRRRVFASHPSAVARAAVVHGVTGRTSAARWEGSFAVSAAAGLVAMYTYQVVEVMLNNLGYFTGAVWASDAAFAAVSLLWAAVVVPTWIRRAEAAARTGTAPSWRGPLTGAVAGLLAGYFLQIPGATPPGTTVVFPGYGPALAAGMLISATGAGTLAAGLASEFPDRLRNRHRRPAVVGAVIAASTALATSCLLTLYLVQQQMQWGSAAADRLVLTRFAFDGAWRFVTVVLLFGLVLAVWAKVMPPKGGGSADAMHLRIYLPITAAGILAGGVAATLSWELRYRPSVSDDRYYLLVTQQFWICAIAGWVVVAVILLRHRPQTAAAAGRRDTEPLSRLPIALIAGLVVSTISGVVQFAAIAVWSAHTIDLQRLMQSVEAPPWLVLVATLAASPCLILGAGTLDRIRRPPGPASSTRGATTLAAFGTAAFVAVTAAAVVGGTLSPMTGEPDDKSRAVAAYDQWQAAENPVVPTPTATLKPTPSPATTATPAIGAAHPPAPDPGRPLDTAAARTALASIPPLLPAGLKLIANETQSIPVTKPAACGEQTAVGDAAVNALPKTADITETYTFPVQGTYGDVITATLGMRSFTRPAPGFTALLKQAAACRQFTVPDTSAADGLAHESFLDSEPTTLPFPGYEDFHQQVLSTRSSPFVNSDVFEIIDIGHNEVAIQFDYTYSGTPTPPSTRQYCEQLATTALNAVIRQLQTG